MPSVACFYMSTIMTHPNVADETDSVSEVQTAAAIVTCWDHFTCLETTSNFANCY